MLLTLFIVAFQTLPAVQDTSFTIQGVVVDSSSGESVPYVNVMLTDDKRGAVTDNNGEFLIANVERRAHTMRVSAVGFKTKFLTIKPGAGPIFRLRIPLKESPPTMHGVTVLGNRKELQYLQPDRTVITPAEAKSNISFFNNDLLGYVTHLPGVVTLSGMSTRYYVRGGSADQNLVTIDGITIYNFAHAFGLFSFLDPRIVKTSTFFAGDFGAQYGNRLSSVMDVRTVDGNPNKLTGNGSVDLFTADPEVSGPLSLSDQGTSSFVGFFRLPMNRGLIKNFFSFNDNFNFYDGFLKAGGDIGSDGKISAEVFALGDNIQAEDFFNPSYRWDQRAAAVSGSFFMGDNYIFNFSVSYSRYTTGQSVQTSQAFQYP